MDGMSKMKPVVEKEPGKSFKGGMILKTRDQE